MNIAAQSSLFEVNIEPMAKLPLGVSFIGNAFINEHM